METKITLEDETLEALQELIEQNLDSAACLREAAEKVDDPELTRLFSAIASDRHAHAVELREYVSANQEEPEDSTSFTGEARKIWLSLRSAINGGDPKVVLIEAERAEDAIKEKYEEVLVDTAGSAMNDILMRHMREIKAHHDQVRDLRDAA